MNDATGETEFLSWHKQFREDFRDYPATMAMGALWIAVFAAMLVNQGFWGGGITWKNVFLGTENGMRFGALTVRDLYAGEFWRLLTATFVHFGLIHITLNLYALYQLGCLVESWYGPGPFLGIYVLTGAGGNLFAAWLRHLMNSSLTITCAGGSTVVMGLVALCAVVGWILRSRSGDHLRNQMIFVIMLTAAIGLGFWAAGLPVIDNWGHAGGTIVGAILGLGNAAILRHGRGIYAKASGWAGVCLIVAGGAAQVADGGAADSRKIQQAQEFEQARRKFLVDEQTIRRLDEIRKVYKVMAPSKAIKRGMLSRELPRRPQKPEPTPDAKPNEKPAPALAHAPALALAPAPTLAEPPATTKAETKERKAEPKALEPALKPEPEPTTGLSPARPNQIMLEPEQELQLVILSSSLRLLTSLAQELDTGESSADYRRAHQLLARTLTDYPSIEEVREFDDRILTLLENVKKDRQQTSDRLKAASKP